MSKKHKKDEQDIRIEARNWCGPINAVKGASENQVENIALYFYNDGYEDGIHGDDRGNKMEIENYEHKKTCNNCLRVVKVKIPFKMTTDDYFTKNDDCPDCGCKINGS